MADEQVDLCGAEEAADGPSQHAAAPTGQQAADDTAAHIGDDAFSSQQALASITIKLKKHAEPAVAASASDSKDPASLPWLHLLPCRIAHTGPANVPNYWQPTKSTVASNQLAYAPDGMLMQLTDTDLYDSRFRGRQMTGAVLQLPGKAQGFIFEDDARNAPSSAGDDAAGEATEELDGSQNSASQQQQAASSQQWKSVASFSSLVLWQPDQELFERKHIREAIEEWIPIAHAIHDV